LEAVLGKLARLAARGPSVLSRPVRYLIAAGLTGLALVLRMLIAPQDAGIQFVTFFPAATLAAVICGIWPGLFATACGAILGVYFFMTPLNAFKSHPEAILSALVFCLDEVVVCTAIETMRSYYQHFVDTAEALRRTNAAEARARREAERANAAKSRFLAAASHDLRQPYQALRLYHAALLGKADEPKAVRDLLQRMESAMTAGEGLLQSLLDLSTLDAGIIEPRPVDVPAPDIIRAIGLRHRPVAEAKGLALHLRTSDGMLHVDPVLLGRLLDNLVANAIRYTASGSVRVAFRRCGGRPTFVVRDTGIGIAPEHHEAVFEEFFQVGNPSRDRAHGAGLGLAVARRTAALMGLELKMRSRLGKGTLFKVSLPGVA
jgi:signal transduction histidine kinase